MGSRVRKLKSPKGLKFDPEGHVYTKGAVVLPGTSGILEDAGFMSAFNGIPQHKKDYYLERGKMYHLACEYVDSKEGVDWDDLDPEIIMQVRGYAKFKKDTKLRILGVEVPLCDKDDTWAGTPDIVAEVPGIKGIVVIDRKFGKPFLPVRPQTASYSKLVEQILGCRRPRRFGLWATSNGAYRFPEYEDPEDFKAWNSALLNYYYKRRNS